MDTTEDIVVIAVIIGRAIIGDIIDRVAMVIAGTIGRVTIGGIMGHGDIAVTAIVGIGKTTAGKGAMSFVVGIRRLLQASHDWGGRK